VCNGQSAVWAACCARPSFAHHQPKHWAGAAYRRCFSLTAFGPPLLATKQGRPVSPKVDCQWPVAESNESSRTTGRLEEAEQG